MKLSPRFYGPYKVLERTGPAAYRLDLPTGAKIHPVFHVSCLKKKLGEHTLVQLHLPDNSPTGDGWVQPHSILDRRIVKRNNKVVVEVLVHWDTLPIEDATWELYQSLQDKYPEFITAHP
ncbi:uncharacterized protein LOC143856954 [Tasmannia lanceolata]|uniref:uncharacterized protein LOC143856954 n=1 Tax=Tasmannia lanceolata TaxID=3420 RepID=UPI004064B734